ncbi:MAG: 3-phosphoshikimate 1-carboxyvinyltransferase [Candidatus Firestonebacteria bacterium RIFOXYC2_FULL_39_67]|nr:MAG: 3-phosphoshikimate 1-carboxyvinyltransferase [Candidatus Firestonebacteria bacterium RIFOXYD2_FULL_39_29]OGF53739.1 MAG: 3-phosphoshikimate 1-carboxyvinyltransferase [Candidatus Firestonebacteria bacterium RifOxyC12_full_39_7]OGF54977.1 MAG: 3-phosphoshikimate 1-carboxyvinyltransferase [Candidatus Firestonebacteria bacterium RIFOXYC2_FULL_39_67]
MQKLIVHKAVNLSGLIRIPGDKSISHRSIMFGSLAKGKTVILNFLQSEDCLSTMDSFKKMGIKIVRKGDRVVVFGKGLFGLKAPKTILNANNSGTTTRLILGILAAQPFTSKITGDKSLCKRPMRRVTDPLREMGASITGKDGGNYTPLTVTGGKLKGINFKSKVASAQVKSAILLAGLYADGKTCVTEPEKSRDHTERMLRYFGVKLAVKGNTVCVKSGQELKGRKIEVPGDISSAAFFIVAGLITPNSKLVLKNVGINPTRTGIIDVLKKMGAKIRIVNKRNIRFEPAADLIVETSRLKGSVIGGKVIPRLIDEIPVLAVAAALAKGKTVFKDAAELRVKESDRIKTLCTELNKFGVKTKEFRDGFIVYGSSEPKGAKSISYGDHRIAMSMAVLALVSEGKSEIRDTACVKTSFPEFFRLFKKIQ